MRTNVGQYRYEKSLIRHQYGLHLLLLLLLLFGRGSSVDSQDMARKPELPSTIAFAIFAPLDTDIFIAAADGSDARPLLPHPDLDYNPSFSPDGRWIVFTSTRRPDPGISSGSTSTTRSTV